MDNSVNGVLQSLMEQYQARMNPQEYQRHARGRNALIDEYEQGVRNAPPGMSQFQMGISNWLGAGGTGPTDIVRGFGRAPAQYAKQQQDEHNARQAGILKTANLRDAVAKEEDAALKAQIGLASKTGLGKQPSPEQLRTVYSGALNHFSQMAKDLDFSEYKDPGAARAQWVRDQTDLTVNNYLAKFATQPTGPRGEVVKPFNAEATDSVGPVAKQSFDPMQVGLQVPAGQGSPDINKLSPAEQQMAAALKAGTGMAQNPATAQAGAQMLQGLQAQFPRQDPGLIKPPAQAPAQLITPQTQSAIANPATQQPIAPPLRNRPAEKGAEKGAQEMAATYVKDYETVQTEAAAAEQQKAAFETLRKLQPNTGLFANAEQVVGGLFSALGQDPNSPAIQNAMRTRNAEQVLSQLTNASLKAEKGVQTKTDEVRIYKEFPKTTDFKQVWDFSVKLGQERAQRKLDQRDFFDSVAAQNNGTPTRARQMWDKQMSNDPITQYLGGKLIFRSDFIRAYENKYPDLGRDGAVQKWREMEQDYQARGGRK